MDERKPTYEELLAENEKIKNEKEKKKEQRRKEDALIFAAVIGGFIGAIVGYCIGYHAAYVDLVNAGIIVKSALMII